MVILRHKKQYYDYKLFLKCITAYFKGAEMITAYHLGLIYFVFVVGGFKGTNLN